MGKYDKAKNSIIKAGTFGIATIFGWMIVKGAIALFPKVSGTAMIITGIIGLSAMIYLGLKK